ncbi:P-loop containing nucleoside triphosphate hydrolase protein [Gaertneriomyces semiglobifer]|nr:P-loop containing nucleoside triphosphate hydrolase protein [Gaertneriomyces semiglobifer]
MAESQMPTATPEPTANDSKHFPPADLKIILLGDSAVGKSALLKRFLQSEFSSQRHSTYALNIFRHIATPTFEAKDSRQLVVDFWDTAGQEQFNTLHPSYYHGAHCAVLVFDCGRKITYKGLEQWYEEVSSSRGYKLPLLVVANKLDLNPSLSSKPFAFTLKHKPERLPLALPPYLPGVNADIDSADPSTDPLLPLFFVSASSGTNVVRVFQESVRRAWAFKESVKAGGAHGAFVDEVLELVREFDERERK